MPKCARPRRSGNTPVFREGATKHNYSVYAPYDLMRRLDIFIKGRGIASRADGIRYLLDAFEQMNIGSSNVNVAKPATRMSRGKQPYSDSSSDSQVKRLKSALIARKPNSLEQWQAVAKSVGDGRSVEECKRYAKAKLNYRPPIGRAMPKRARPRRTVNPPAFRKGAAKHHYSVYAPYDLMRRLDIFIKGRGIPSRADGIRYLLDAFEQMNIGSSNVNVSKPATRVARGKQLDTDSWSDSQVKRLKSALIARKPNSLEQWQAVAKSVGDGRSVEECKRYAKAKLNYRPPTGRAMPKRARPRRSVNPPAFRKEAAKHRYSVCVQYDLMRRLDNFIKGRGIPSRADGIRYLLDACEQMNIGSSNVNVAKPATRMSHGKQPDTDSWSDSQVKRLKRALIAGKPNSPEQWQAVAKSVGGGRSVEECKCYAKAKLNYRPPIANNERPTIPARQENEYVLRRLVTSEEESDCFVNAQKATARHVPLVDSSDISGLSTPSSGISYGSRCMLVSRSSSPLSIAATDNTESIKETRLEKRKRANLRISRRLPMLKKANAAKRVCTRSAPITKSKRASGECSTSQLDLCWRNLKPRTRYAVSESSDDSYFDDGTA